MSLQYAPVAFLVCLGFTFATPGQANNIRFDQSNPTIMTLNITQIGVGHAVHGFAADKVTADPTSGATLKGNFDTVSLQQTSISDSAIALNVDVGSDALSDVFVDLSGSGTHSVMLEAVAHELTSSITLEGPEAKSVNVTVDAAGKLVSHDIKLSGSEIELTASQQVAANLSVDLFSRGLNASVSINQTGEDSTADILGNLYNNATLIFNQTGTIADYTLDVTLNPDSMLTFNQAAGGDRPNGSKVTVGSGQSVTMTHTSSTNSLLLINENSP